MNQSNEERLQQLLCAYVLNEVNEAERKEVEEALAASEELRAEKARFESTIALVAGAYDGEEKLPESSVAILNAAAAGRGGRVIQGPWYRKASVRVAAAALFVVGAYGAVKLLEGDPQAKRDDLVAVAATVEMEARRDTLKVPASGGVAVKDTIGVERIRNQTSEDVLLDLAEFEVPLYEAEEELVRADDSIPFKDAQTPPGAEVVREWKKQLAAAEVADDSRPARRNSAVPLDRADSKGEAFIGLIQTEGTGSKGLAGGGGTYKGPGDTGPPGGPAATGPGGVAGPNAPSAGLTTPGRSRKSKKARPGLASSSLSATAAVPFDGEPHPNPPALVFPPPMVQAFTLEVVDELAALGYAGDDELASLDAYGYRGEVGELELSGELDLKFFGVPSNDVDEDDNDDHSIESRRGEYSLRAFDSVGRKRIALTADEITTVTELKCGLIIRSCLPRLNESPRDMFFRYYGDNPFVMADVDKLSTFAADVDTSSYVLVRNYLKNRKLPTKAQVRTEEFVNYFRPDVPAPTEGVFNIVSELAPSRFSAQPGRWMLRVAVRGREVSREERKPLNLTFVTDTSGSMKEHNRMGLVKHALRLLVTQLDARDSIAIVGFAEEATVVLPMTSVANRGVIESAIYSLQPEGGTNPEAGLIAGYAIAVQALSQNSHNRVVLLSDGVGNIGETDQNRITETVKSQRELGIYLNTIGVGMNNHNDEFLEQLANKGDGLSNYIDDELEARRALVENFTGAFETIARDVKIQVEFDPSQVYRYRQLGYENRAIADADFRNDKVDAGEIGAGHQVVCLYEIELDPSYNGDSASPLATVRLRYKQPTGAGRHPAEDSATEITHIVRGGSGTSFEGTTAGFRRSVIAAQFAEILRRSEHARGDSITDVIAAAAKLAPEIRDADFQEMLDLMSICRGEILKRNERRSDLGDCISNLRRHNLRVAQYERLGAESDQVSREDLVKLGTDLEESVRRIIRRRIEAEQLKLSDQR